MSCLGELAPTQPQIRQHWCIHELQMVQGAQGPERASERERAYSTGCRRRAVHEPATCCMYVCMHACMYKLVDFTLPTTGCAPPVALILGALNRLCSSPPSPPVPPSPCPLPRQVLSLSGVAPAVVLGCMTSCLSWEPRRGNKVQLLCELRVSDVVPDQAEPSHPASGSHDPTRSGPRCDSS